MELFRTLAFITVYILQCFYAITNTARRSVDSHFFNPPRPVTDWENGLREATYQVLLRQYHKDPNLRNYVKTAPIIGHHNNVTPFGDIAVIARGQLYVADEGLIFVQDPYQNDCDECHPKTSCNRRDCSPWIPENLDKLLALWSVKRIRHRDPNGEFRYELKYTISPINRQSNKIYIRRDGGFDYNIPGHVFLLQGNQNGVPSQKSIKGIYRPVGLYPIFPGGSNTESLLFNNFQPATPIDYFPRIPHFQPPLYPVQGNNPIVVIHKTEAHETPLGSQLPAPTYLPSEASTPKSKNPQEIYQDLLQALKQKTQKATTYEERKDQDISTLIPKSSNQEDRKTEQSVTATTGTFSTHVQKIQNTVSSSVPNSTTKNIPRLPTLSKAYSKTTKYSFTDIWNSGTEPTNTESYYANTYTSDPIYTQITKAVVTKLTTTPSPMEKFKETSKEIANANTRTVTPFNVAKTGNTRKIISTIESILKHATTRNRPHPTSEVSYEIEIVTPPTRDTQSASSTEQSTRNKISEEIDTTELEIIPVSNASTLLAPMLDLLRPILGSNFNQEADSSTSKTSTNRAHTMATTITTESARYTTNQTTPPTITKTIAIEKTEPSITTRVSSIFTPQIKLPPEKIQTTVPTTITPSKSVKTSTKSIESSTSKKINAIKEALNKEKFKTRTSNITSTEIYKTNTTIDNNAEQTSHSITGSTDIQSNTATILDIVGTDEDIGLTETDKATPNVLLSKEVVVELKTTENTPKAGETSITKNNKATSFTTAKKTYKRKQNRVTKKRKRPPNGLRKPRPNTTTRTSVKNQTPKFTDELFGTRKTTTFRNRRKRIGKNNNSVRKPQTDVDDLSERSDEFISSDFEGESTTEVPNTRIIFSDFYFARTENPEIFSSIEEEVTEGVNRYDKEDVNIDKLNTTIYDSVPHEETEIPTSQSISTSISYIVNKINKTENAEGKTVGETTMLKATVKELKHESGEFVIYKAEFPDGIDLDNTFNKTELETEYSTEPEVKNVLNNITLSIVNHARTLDLLESSKRNRNSTGYTNSWT